MIKKKQLGVLAGYFEYPRSLNVFSQLLDDFEVTIFAFEELATGFLSNQIKIVYFKTISETPGFMKKVEDRLSQMDVILCFGQEALYSFQGLKVAKSFAKPFIVYSHNTSHNRYENCRNIMAIQKVIRDYSTEYIVPCELSRSVLEAGSIDRSRIHNVGVFIDSSFRPCSEKRDRFRSGLGIKKDDLLVTYHNELNFCFQPNLIVEAYARLRNKLTEKIADKVKILFLGRGRDSNSIKQLARNTGFGQAFYFIHDDITSITEQIYSGCDIIVETPCLDKNRVQQYPYPIFEAMNCGVSPIAVESGALGSFGENSIYLYDGSIDSLVERMVSLVQSAFGGHEPLKERLVSYSNKLWDSKVLLDVLLRPWSADGSQALEDRLSSGPVLLAEVGENKLEEKLSLLDEKLTSQTVWKPQEKAGLLTQKGDALIEMKKIDDAQNSYELAIEIDENNSDAYRGLGYVHFVRYANNEAISFLKKSLGLNINDWRALFWMSLVHHRIGLYEDALYWLKKSIALGVEDKIVLTALIQFCTECPSHELAMTTLEEAVETIGEDPNLMVALAQAYVRCGRTGLGAQIMNRYLPE